MVIAASSHDEQEAARLAENAKETALRATQESEKKVVVAAMTVDEGKVQAAKELGVSPGKLTLVEQLKETASDPETIDVKEWLEKPVKDIMKETASRMPDNSSASSCLLTVALHIVSNIFAFVHTFFKKNRHFSQITRLKVVCATTIMSISHKMGLSEISFSSSV